LNGTVHMALGAATGFVVANNFQTDPAATLSLVALGGVSGLVPDLDVNGKLSNKITSSHKFIKKLAQFIGLLVILYSFLEGMGSEKWLGIGAGTGILIIASFITRRHMLTMTGVGVFAGGLSLAENWLLLFGVYIIIASLISHRSYTHSILGVVFFAVIAYQFELSAGIEGIFITCVAGYITHLIADLKVLPSNKRGVKLLLPFSSKEF
jgi:inner membrane protein